VGWYQRPKKNEPAPERAGPDTVKDMIWWCCLSGDGSKIKRRAVDAMYQIASGMDDMSEVRSATSAMRFDLHDVAQVHPVEERVPINVGQDGVWPRMPEEHPTNVERYFPVPVIKRQITAFAAVDTIACFGDMRA